MAVEKTITVTWDVTPAELAEVFAAMDDEDQAMFFTEVAKRFEAPAMAMQMAYFAKHMVDCECVSKAGRDFVRDLVEHLDAFEASPEKVMDPL